MAGAREVDLDPDKMVGLTLPLGEVLRGFLINQKRHSNKLNIIL